MTRTVLLSPLPLPGLPALSFALHTSAHLLLKHQHLLFKKKKRKKKKHYIYSLVSEDPDFANKSGLHPHLPTHTCLSEGLPQVGLHRVQIVESFLFICFVAGKQNQNLVHTNHVLCPGAAPKV